MLVKYIIMNFQEQISLEFEFNRNLIGYLASWDKALGPLGGLIVIGIIG